LCWGTGRKVQYIDKLRLEGARDLI
jgi:SpoVK/Ycf46/Vps4 family AAA+-type ATPase